MKDKIMFILILAAVLSCTKTTQTVVKLPPTYETWLGWVIKSDSLITGTYCIPDFDNPPDTIVVQHTADTSYQNAFLRYTDSKPFIYKYYKIRLQ